MLGNDTNTRGGTTGAVGTTAGAMVEVVTGVMETAGASDMVLLLVERQETPDLAPAGLGGGCGKFRRWAAAAAPAVLWREKESLWREKDGSLLFGGVLTWLPAGFLVVSLAVREILLWIGDLALVFCCSILFPFEAAWGEATPTLVAAVSVAFWGVLRLGVGSLDVAEAPMGVLRVGMGSFEAPSPGVLRGGKGTLHRPLPVVVAPGLAAPPPESFLVGTGSLDFQAALPAPRTLPVGGGAAAPLPSEIPANLLAAGVVGCLPVVMVAAAAATAAAEVAIAVLAAAIPRFPEVPANLLAVGVVGCLPAAAVAADITIAVLAAATPCFLEVPANLSAVGGVVGCLPIAAAAAETIIAVLAAATRLPEVPASMLAPGVIGYLPVVVAAAAAAAEITAAILAMFS